MRETAVGGEPVEHLLGVAGGLAQRGEVGAVAGREHGRGVGLQQVGEAAHGVDRRTQVVGGERGELGEVGVGALELARAEVERGVGPAGTGIGGALARQVAADGDDAADRAGGAPSRSTTRRRRARRRRARAR